ncbi:MAG: GNAT family N-acetyltransferase [Rhodoblastus sp.]|nr:GNAT family N-acetyltransferase [Rhodoblastus sp.]MCB1524872.1 GNAT family N-acetyltransferase [Rhodoblastus sp.]MCC2108655.1 GNAT family N-acetyltransferase [Hyphomicrobiales bacterium]HPG03643.1 GNAT family protein [Rhodoblastus sp.]
MALFRLGPSHDHSAFVRGDGVFLRPAEMGDFPEWSRLREHSRNFLTPWEPVWPSDDLTRAAFRRRIRRHAEEMARDEAFPFLIFRARDKALVGGLTIGQIRRGVAQAGTIGYWVGVNYAGQGYMSRALRAAVAHSFASLRLHRVEAACLPTNMASIRVLESAGFKREGLARSYLRINGRWQDHLLFAVLENDPPLPPRLRLRNELDGGRA